MNKRAFRNHIKDQIFKYMGLVSTFIGIALLAIFIISILKDGLGRIDFQFLSSLPSRKAEKAGILTAWTGSLWIFGLTAIFSIVIGVSTGVYLEEYAKKTGLQISWKLI